VITIQPEDPGDPEVFALVASLDALMEALYPVASNHLLDVETLRQPDIKFFVARYDDVAVGCGAYRVLGPEHAADSAVGKHAEIKRMFVTPVARGMRLGQRLLLHLETDAWVAGIGRLFLETGIHQPEAINLYARAGFQECPPFAEYKPDPLSLFMTKMVG
jgi:putative acetyltransferase